MENLFIHEAPGCDKAMLETMVAEGDFRAYAELARCYLKKVFPSYEEFLEGKKLLEQGAAKGDDNAMAELWDMCHHDKKRAQQWGRKIHALHVKNHEAAPSLQTEFDLAVDYEFGWGVVPDLREAKRRYESLARRGFGMAYYALGLFYEDGRLGRRHLPAAMRRYQSGAALHDPNCMLRMAKHYMEPGEEHNPVEAYRLYRMLSTLKYGHPIAQVKMAEYYIFELYGNEKADWEKAKQYLAAAESLGSYDAQVMLKALLLTEQECIKMCGSVEATTKEQRNARFAGAVRVVEDELLEMK